MLVFKNTTTVIKFMVDKGLLIRLEARPGKDSEAEEFLVSVLPDVQREEGTTAWFAVRFGRSEYGIVGAFGDDETREVHLNGAVMDALSEKSDLLFNQAPVIQKADILASKLPEVPVEPSAKGLLLTFKAQESKSAEAEEFLKDAKPMVDEEPETIAWLAFRLDSGEYGIFDTFPSNRGRLKHLSGKVPQELVKESFSMLGSFPDMDMLSVLAEKLDSVRFIVA